jgi:hypothetical protein
MRLLFDVTAAAVLGGFFVALLLLWVAPETCPDAATALFAPETCE